MAIGKRNRWVIISAAVAATLGGGQRARAGNFYWEGDASSNWNAAGGFFGSNWSSQLALNNDPLALPGSGDEVFFYGLSATGPINTTLGQNFSIQSLTFLTTNDQPVS